MDGNDPTLNKVRLNHLTEVAEKFTGEDWRSDKVIIIRLNHLICFKIWILKKQEKFY